MPIVYATASADLETVRAGMRVGSHASGAETSFPRVAGQPTPGPRYSLRNEAVGKSVPSGGFKTLPRWLGTSWIVNVVSCC